MVTQTELVQLLCARQRQLDEALAQGNAPRARALDKRVILLAEQIVYGLEQAPPHRPRTWTLRTPTKDYPRDPYTREQDR